MRAGSVAESPVPLESVSASEALSTGKGAAIATAGTALSRITGFVRLAALTYALGVAESKLADTYNLANTTPNIVYELVLGGILSSVLVRVYVEVKQAEGQEEAWQFVSRLTTMVMLVSSAISAVAILLAPWIFEIYTFATPRSAPQQQAGAFLLRLFIPQLLFYGLSTISTAVLNAHRKFGVPMFAPVLNNLAVSAILVFFALQVPEAMRELDEVGVGPLRLLGLGTTLGVALMGLVPWFYMRRIGYRFSIRAGLVDPRFRKIARLSAYMFGYVAINQIGLAITMILANRVQGGVTAYQYAFIFFQLPHGLLAVSIATAIFPGLTERAVAGDLEGVAERLGTGLRQIAFFIFPAVAGYIAIAPQLVDLLLRHGLTTAASTAFIAFVLRAWAPGILFFSTFYLLLRGFYALGDTRTPMLVNLGALAVNLAVNLVLFFSLEDARDKIAGLAIGHSASYAAASAAAAWLMFRRLGKRVFPPRFTRAVLQMAAAALLTGAGAWLTASSLESLHLRGGRTLAVLTATAAGVVIYAGAAKALRLDEVNWIGNIIAARSRGG